MTKAGMMASNFTLPQSYYIFTIPGSLCILLSVNPLHGYFLPVTAFTATAFSRTTFLAGLSFRIPSKDG